MKSLKQMLMNDHFGRAIYVREHLGINSITLIVGARGEGKSFLGAGMCERYNWILHKRRFGVEDIVFSTEEMLQRINYYDNNELKWRWIMMDEAGISASARKFMTEKNQILSEVLETFRDTGTHLVCVVPAKTMVDVNVKRLSDFYIVMEGRKRAKINVTRIHHYRDKWKTKRLTFLIDSGSPTPTLQHYYKQKRKVRMREHRRTRFEMLETMRKRREPAVSVRREELLEQIKQAYKDGRLKKKEVGYEIMRRLQISQGVAYSIRRGLLKEVEGEKQAASE